MCEREHPGSVRRRYVIAGDKDGGKDEFFKVWTEREKSQHDRTTVLEMTLGPTEHDSELRKVRPARIEAAQHVRAKRDRAQRETAQPRFRLDDYNLLRGAEVTFEREVLEHGDILEQ